jgi:hypothetical protein
MNHGGKCLYRHQDGKCITEQDVDKAIREAIEWNEVVGVQKEWMSHPKFKREIIAMSRSEQVHPETTIEDVVMAAGIEDMKADLRAWGRK